jgi:methionine synthase I (cobalamin-dependent)
MSNPFISQSVVETMNALHKLLQIQDTIVLDGAMGTMLFAAGLKQGDPPEVWNVEQPSAITAVHQAYIDAGSQIVLTNSFGGTRYRLKLHNLQERVAELNRAAAHCARQAADAAARPVVVAGSIGPTGEILSPMGSLPFADARDAFAEQAAALAEGGVDVLWIETMSALEEVQAAVEGIRSVTDLPICATMTFDTRGYTMMGVSPQQALAALSEWGLAAIGGNCGNGLEEIESVIDAMHRADGQAVLIAKSNAGIPRWENNELIYDGTPPIMADYARRIKGLGARLIGGCCGSSPVHIEAMVAALERPLTPAEQADLKPRGPLYENAQPTRSGRRASRRSGR